MKPLILTGFMGCGKSTIGHILASQLQSTFLDADTFFTEHAGLTPTFYIRRFGIQSFRKLERQFLNQILADPPQILSTGGGAVLQAINRQLMLKKGIVVWVQSPLSHILVRLNKRVLRPMLPRPISLKDLEALYAVRKPFYKKCHFAVSNAFRTPKEVANEVMDKYKALGKSYAS